MCNRLIFLTVLGAVFIGTCHALPPNSNEMEARKFVESVSEKLNSHYTQLSQDIFNMEGRVPSDDMSTIMSTAKAMAQIVNDSKVFDVSQFKDEELKYIFKKIRRSADEAVIGEEDFISAKSFQLALSELSGLRDIPAYNDKSVKLAYSPDIQNIFARSNDPEELKFYWSEWREKYHVGATFTFFSMVSYLDKSATLTEIPRLEYWLRDFSVPDMENVMNQIQPLYKQLHAFIRNQLHKKYGDSVIKSTGPIPDHLFEQVLAQIWTNGSVIDEMYPHGDLPPYDSILEKNNYDALKLYKKANKFYQSLGFNPIPDNLWGSQIKMQADEDESDCQAAILDLTPNVYMQFCKKVDFEKFLQAHGYMGRLYYAREKTGLPAYYFTSNSLETPVGEAVILSASTPKHLNAIGMVTDFEFTDKVQMNRLLRQGIHTLLNIPVFFVHTKVMVALLTESTESDAINKYYWSLMDKYAGVEPPVDRTSSLYDLPFSFYSDLNENQQAVNFYSKILGYQFYKKLCQISGQYLQEPLQNCDFYRSKDVGNALKKIMKLGSSKPLHEVLATLLPETPRVNAESLLEYYQPMMTWLTNKNVETNVKLGWDHSDKKIF